MQPIYRSLRALPFRRGPRRWVGGICSGLARRYGWDPNLLRLIMLVSFLLPVVGLGAYVVAWILIPWSDDSIVLERGIAAVRNRG